MSLDGSLLTWQEVQQRHPWAAILLGNGLSINVWPRFAYGSLFEHARDGGLTHDDLALFDGTPNFERVLADLNTTMRVAGIAKVDARPFRERHRRIQLALGHAVREVHVQRRDVPDAVLQDIRGALLAFEWVFTTSYDLLAYWAMGASPGGRFEPFVDHFRWANRCEFDAARAPVLATQVPVYFLHGALHLVAGSDGKVWKLRRNAIQNLLDQFGQPIPEDRDARPLLVTEGSSRDKLHAIESNDYLSHALDRLKAVDVPLVVFGSSLGLQDQHLVEALNEHPDRPVAVSMRPGPKRLLAAQQADIYSRLRAEALIFYDSTTCPLGRSDLTVVSRAA